VILARNGGLTWLDPRRPEADQRETVPGSGTWSLPPTIDAEGRLWLHSDQGRIAVREPDGTWSDDDRRGDGRWPVVAGRRWTLVVHEEGVSARRELDGAPRELSTARVDAVSLFEDQAWLVSGGQLLEWRLLEDRTVVRASFDRGENDQVGLVTGGRVRRRRVGWLAVGDQPVLQFPLDPGDGEPTRLAVRFPSGFVVARIDPRGDLDLVGITRSAAGDPELTAHDARLDATVEGYPVPLAVLPRGVLPIDLDGDGFDEVVVDQDPGLSDAWGRGGTRVPGFPKVLGGSATGPATAADLDGDGHPDWAVSTVDGHVLVFRGFGESTLRWAGAFRDAGATFDLRNPLVPRGPAPDSDSCATAAGAPWWVALGLGWAALGRRGSRRPRRRKSLRPCSAGRR
jgi:hypothetical protein